MRYRIVLVFLTLTFLASAQWKQEMQFAYLHPQQDSVHASKKWDRPQKATVWSAVLPGAGQIYNKKYWKAGVVYAGTAGLVYLFKSNVDSLKYYQHAYEVRLDGDSTTVDTRYSYLSDAAVKSYRDFHRRFRDISILGFVGLYALQIIDANVDAHLYEFQINEDLSMRLEPEIRPMAYSNESYHGLRLTLTF